MYGKFDKNYCKLNYFYMYVGNLFMVIIYFYIYCLFIWNILFLFKGFQLLEFYMMVVVGKFFCWILGMIVIGDKEIG